MSKDIRKMIDKVKNFKQFVNEQKMNENDIKILTNSFLSFYIQEQGYTKIPEQLIPNNIKNKFTKYYVEDDNVYANFLIHLVMCSNFFIFGYLYIN